MTGKRTHGLAAALLACVTGAAPVAFLAVAGAPAAQAVDGARGRRGGVIGARGVAPRRASAYGSRPPIPTGCGSSASR